MLGAPEEEEKADEGGGTHNNLDGKEQVQQLGGADKTQVSIDEDPSSDGEEKVKLQENKVKKRKRSELQQIKQEKLFSDAHQPHLPCGAEQEHLLAAAEEEDESEKVQLQENKVKKKKRSDAVKGQVLVDVGEPSSKATCPLRWRASYCTLLHHKYQKPKYKGSIILDPEENRVTLLDVDETTVDARYLKEGDFIYPKLVLKFPCHKAEIGKQILLANEVKLKKRKRSEGMAKEMSKTQQPMSSPQAKLVGSSIGMFARVAALRKRMSPQVQGRKSESPSVPSNVTTHFPSPNLPRVGADFTRHRPRKLKSKIWKDFIPIYEHGKVVEGQCKHCNEVFPSSKSSGTNHIHRHLRQCETRSSMHEMVAKMRASTPSPRVSLDNWTFSQKECRKDLANMIVHHGLPFSIVEYSGFRKFVKSLNPMFKMVSRTIIREDCMQSYKEQRSLLRETLKNCGARVSLTADMWTSNQRLGYLCVTCHFIDKTCIARDVLAIQASTVASESSFSASGRILTDHRSRLKSKMVEALICLQDWLKAADPKPISKDVEEEECLVFYQVSECHEETAAHQAKGGSTMTVL